MIKLENNKIYVDNREIKHKKIGDEYFLSLKDILTKLYGIRHIKFIKIKDTKNEEIIDVYIGKQFTLRYLISLFMMTEKIIYCDINNDIFITNKWRYMSKTVNSILSKLDLERVVLDLGDIK